MNQEAGIRPDRDNLVLSVLSALGSFVVVVLMGTTVMGLAFAPTAEERAALADARSRTVEAGQESRIYSTHCARCHGASGQGLIGPSLIGIADRRPVDEHEMIVRNGRNNMPAFGGILSDAQITAVVAFERDELGSG